MRRRRHWRRALLEGASYGDPSQLVAVETGSWWCCLVRCDCGGAPVPRWQGGAEGPWRCNLGLACSVWWCSQRRRGGGGAVWAVSVIRALPEEWGGGWDEAPTQSGKVRRSSLALRREVSAEALLELGARRPCLCGLLAIAHGGGVQVACSACSELRLWPCLCGLLAIAKGRGSCGRFCCQQLDRGSVKPPAGPSLLRSGRLVTVAAKMVSCLTTQKLVGAVATVKVNNKTDVTHRFATNWQRTDVMWQFSSIRALPGSPGQAVWLFFSKKTKQYGKLKELKIFIQGDELMADLTPQG
jgi:hypothetical protein